MGLNFLNLLQLMTYAIHKWFRHSTLLTKWCPSSYFGQLLPRTQNEMRILSLGREYDNSEKIPQLWHGSCAWWARQQGHSSHEQWPKDTGQKARHGIKSVRMSSEHSAILLHCNRNRDLWQCKCKWVNGQSIEIEMGHLSLRKEFFADLCA